MHHDTIGDGIPIDWAAGEGDGLSSMIVVPSIFGVHEDLQQRMAALADDGALVVGFDPFWRVKPGVVAYDDFAAAMERVNEVNRDEVYDDMKTVVAWIRDNPRTNGRVAGLGICFGGPFCLVAAADGVIDGIVTWHGSRMHNWVERAAEMKVPMRLHFGGDDPFVPMDQVDKVRAAFAGRDDVQLVIHEGAGHGFSHEGQAYQEKAATAGQRAAREILALLRA